MCVCRINNLDGSAAGEDTNLAQMIGGRIKQTREGDECVSERKVYHEEERMLVFTGAHSYDDEISC